jgi:hypothetical protein
LVGIQRIVLPSAEMAMAPSPLEIVGGAAAKAVHVTPLSVE